MSVNCSIIVCDSFQKKKKGLYNFDPHVTCYILTSICYISASIYYIVTTE